MPYRPPRTCRKYRPRALGSADAFRITVKAAAPTSERRLRLRCSRPPGAGVTATQLPRRRCRSEEWDARVPPRARIHSMAATENSRRKGSVPRHDPCAGATASAHQQGVAPPSSGRDAGRWRDLAPSGRRAFEAEAATSSPQRRPTGSVARVSLDRERASRRDARVGMFSRWVRTR